MKISDVKVDIVNWKSQGWKTGVGTMFGQDQQLGIVTVETDQGVSGNAFLGSSRMGAQHFVPGLIEFIKPMIMGRNPQDIGAIWWEMWKMNRSVATNVIGAIDICLWDINGKTTGSPFTAFWELVKKACQSIPPLPITKPKRPTWRKPFASGKWAGPPTNYTPTARPSQISK